MDKPSDLMPSKVGTDLEAVSQDARIRAIPFAFLYTFPWWALILALVTIWVYVSIAADETYSNIFDDLKEGIALTLRLSIVSYLLALVIGLMIGIIRSAPPYARTGLRGRIVSFLHVVVYNVATLFVEVMRGLPIITVLLISAFVVIPAFKRYMLAQYGIEITFRGSSPETAIIGLALAYGAFLSEVFRAGIQSIGKGQIEAARSLGMTYAQTMRCIVLPQALRRIVPPLGNDFIAMIKDSSLATILAVREITQIAKVTSGSNFQYEPTYLTVAVLYLSMTIIGSLLVRLLENVMSPQER